jgi:hypothetical protein
MRVSIAQPFTAGIPGNDPNVGLQGVHAPFILHHPFPECQFQRPSKIFGFLLRNSLSGDVLPD